MTSKLPTLQKAYSSPGTEYFKKLEAFTVYFISAFVLVAFKKPNVAMQSFENSDITTAEAVLKGNLPSGPLAESIIITDVTLNKRSSVPKNKARNPAPDFVLFAILNFR